MDKFHTVPYRTLPESATHTLPALETFFFLPFPFVKPDYVTSSLHLFVRSQQTIPSHQLVLSPA